MTQQNVTFDSLVKAIASLKLEEKRKLWQILQKAIADAEENLLEEDDLEPLEEIEAAQQAYRAGDYLTLAEYIAHRSGKSE